MHFRSPGFHGQGCAGTLALAAVLWAATTPAAALDAYVGSGPGRLMIGGYDTTAYFDAGAPRRGRQPHTVSWRGVTWRFASPRAAATFQASPGSYEPQFGG